MEAVRVAVISFIIALVISGHAMADDFRGFGWGSSIKAVEKGEKSKLLDKDAAALMYEDEVGGLPVMVLYGFLDGKLNRGVIGVQSRHSNPDDYISDYKRLNEILYKKYGKPEKDDEIWKGERNEYLGKGLSLKTGRLVYISNWVTETAKIDHYISGDNYKISHAILYNDPSVEEKAKQRSESSDMGKL